jgi:hypothetical protein
LYCALRGQPSNVAQGRVLLRPRGSKDSRSHLRLDIMRASTP